MKKHRILFWLILLMLAACEMVLAWKVEGFSDIYVKYVFRLFGATYARLTGLCSFSLGEILIYAGVVFVIFTIVVWITRVVNVIDKKPRLKILNRINFKILIRLLIFIALVQVQNCFVLYHTTPLYEGTEYENYEADLEDLISLREMLVKRANELSETFERDNKGEIIYDGDMSGIAKVSMQGLGEAARNRIENGKAEVLDDKLSLLSGYYPFVKPFLKSDFFSQQYIKGYYFPFTLEANYNNLMYIANIPDTMCHELSHLKGFIYEDEATFLAYLGCLNSKDDFFIYSGTINALTYVSKQLKTELALKPEIRETLTPVSELVSFDATFLTKEAWEIVESDAWFETKKIERASDTFLDTNLTLNGVKDGISSYSRVVDLLLKYYYGGKSNG